MNAPGNLYAPHTTSCATRRFLHALICLYLLAVPYTCLSSCWAQDAPADITDNQTLQVSFFSLKPGSSIGPSRLHLRPGGLLDVSIPGETLTSVGGSWSLQQRRFAAAADFTLDGHPLFHYRLVWNGFGVLGRYAGRARLLEYDRQDRLMQEIIFLFYAEKPGTRPGFGRGSAP